METVQENSIILPQENPLLNSTVLKKVFQYLEPSASLDTLKSIRQVCTVWRDESLGWWRETGVLNLTRAWNQDPKLTTLTQLMEEKPFHKYKLKNITISICDSFEAGTVLNHFWNGVGPHIKHLKMEEVRFWGTEYPKPVQKPAHLIMHFLIEKLPNLRSLEIQRGTMNDMSVVIDKSILPLQHPNLLSLNFGLVTMFAFSNFPNLQHLVINKFGTLYRMVRNEQLSSEGNSIVHSSLKNLELIVPERSRFIIKKHKDFIVGLYHLKFPILERLSFDFRHGRHNNGFNLLPVILRNHANLKTLEVTCRPNVRPYSKFPFDCKLDHLTELRLWGNVVKDLSFLKWMPKLKMLHMDPYGLEKKDIPGPKRQGNMHLLKHDMVAAAVKQGGMEGVVLDDLEYLQISCGLLSLKSLETLRKWMPNVKTLRMDFGIGALPVICNQWPLLEHIVAMHGSVVYDHDIIGRDAGTVMWTGDRVKGLVDLVELKSFHLNTTCNQGRLTDRVVHLGFLKMAKLTDLQVCAGKNFTLEAEELLKEGILNVVIIRNYSSNDEHENWECCKNTKIMDFLEDYIFEDSDGNAPSDEDSEEDDDYWDWQDGYHPYWEDGVEYDDTDSDYDEDDVRRWWWGDSGRKEAESNEEKD